MNLRSLEYLVAVADERHFGRAAARCQVSQPTLSAQLRRFEAELGGPLIVRGARVELTELGHRVIGPARQILSLADDISWAARDQEGPVTGTVQIGIFPTLAAYLLPHLLAGLEREAPGVSLSVVEEMSGTLLRLLDAGEIDVALLASEVPGGLEAVPVFREEFLLATPADDPLGAEPGPVDPEQLRGTDLILMSEGHCLRDQVLDVCAESGSGVRRDVHPNSVATLSQLVAAGSGRTLMPRMAVSPPMAPDPRIALREFISPRPHRDVTLCGRPAVMERRAVQALISVLRDLPGGFTEPLGQAVPTEPVSV